MRVLPISSNYCLPKVENVNRKNQPLLKNVHHSEPTFKSKSTWKGVGGAIIGAVIAGPIGAALLGVLGAGYGAMEDSLDEDKKNGTDWSKMPDIV